MDKGTHIGDTIRIRRPPRVTTDPLGRTIWMSDVEPFDLTLEEESAQGVDPYDTAAGAQWSRQLPQLMRS